MQRMNASGLMGKETHMLQTRLKKKCDVHIQRCQGIRKASEADLLKAKSNARDLRALKEKVSAVRATEQQLAELHKAKSLLDSEFFF